MGVLDFFKNVIVKSESVAKNDNQPVEKSSSGWREAAKSSGYGIEVPQPKFSKDIKLCIRLGVPEKTREKLEKFLMRNWNSRSNNLVEEFNLICSEEGVIPDFPKEIETIVLRRYKRKPNQESVMKKVAEIYIRHELSVLRTDKDLTNFRELNVKKVKIRTCKDQRVCSTCKKHERKAYNLNQLPAIPMCWECRCYYEPIIK